MNRGTYVTPPITEGWDGTGNPVVLTGDIHWNWANELIDELDFTVSLNVVVGFVSTFTSTNYHGHVNVDKFTALPAKNPAFKSHNDKRGYVCCEVSPRRMEDRLPYCCLYRPTRCAGADTRIIFGERGQTKVGPPVRIMRFDHDVFTLGALRRGRPVRRSRPVKVSRAFGPLFKRIPVEPN